MHKITHICLLACALLVGGVVYTQAAVRDSLRTSYADGTFRTYCQVVVPCQRATADAVVNDLVHQFQGDPQRLFDWALKGLGQQADGSDKDAVVLVLKKTTFDEHTGVNTLLFDAVVPGLTTFHDIEVESLVTRQLLADGRRRVKVDIFRTSTFLKSASGVFYVQPLASERMLLSIDIRIKFGWFFNIFITQKRYKALAEFRIQGFMENLRDECLRRER